MPENETLLPNDRNASRWRQVSERLDGGGSPSDTFPAIQDRFYKSLRNVWRQWNRRGVEPARLFDAVLNDPKVFLDLLRQTGFDRNARLLQDVAIGLQDVDFESLVRGFIDASWECVRDQLQLDRREEALSPDFLSQVQGMLGRISRRLMANPSRFPSCPRKEPPHDLDTRLGESLL